MGRSKTRFERRQELEKKKKNNIRQFFLERAKDLEKTPECSTRFIEDCLISLHFKDGHMHHLLPGATPLEDFIDDLIALEGIDRGSFLDEVEAFAEKPKEPESPKEITQISKALERKPIIFKNRQAIGDILMMTVGVRDFRKAFPDWPMNVSTTAMHIWDNNPHLNRELNINNAEVIEIGPSYLTNASNRDDRHFANAFRISIQDKLKISFKQGAIKPDIWMTKEETESPLIIKPPYWIIVAGEKGDWTTKTYPFERWQHIIEFIGSEHPEMKFVQVGAKEHVHPKLEGDNVINFIGKTQDRNTGIRDLFKLFYYAEGSMGLVSFQTHLAAAFNMPCIVIAGAREPARFTRYPNQQYLCTDGCLPCASDNSCWHCDMEKTCKNIVESEGKRYPKCVDIICEDDVITAFYQFYEGGRLSWDKPRVPTLPNKVSAMSIPLVMIPKKEEEVHSKFGLLWGGSAPTKLDWEFMEKVLKEIKAKTVLEFGSGLSTLLMADMGLKVISYETDERWISETSRRNKDVNIKMWDGTEQSFPGEDGGDDFDFVFVDGPAGGESREWSVKIASLSSDNIIVHDAGRVPDRKWQDKYLSESFELVERGGHRCHWWRKKEVNPEKMERPNEWPPPPDQEIERSPKVTQVNTITNKKTLKVIFNGRGEGGAERSTTWLMNEFIKIGWDVEYLTPTRPSGTFNKLGSEQVAVRLIDINNKDHQDYISRPCDVLLLASNDWVWDFPTEPVSSCFGGLRAKRKVMYINYRIGEIGKLSWTQEWDQYLFLNSELESAFRSHYMNSKSSDEMYSFGTKVLPPPTDLIEYYKNEIDYSGSIRLVRHSSQGDAKYPKDFNEKIERILEKFPKVIIRLMPGPSFLEDFGDRVVAHKRNQPSVKDFLSLGNVFWYHLPEKYTEGGPKVIMEAMASGLPVIAGNHSGPKNRVTKDTGFLCNSFEEELEAIDYLLNENERYRMGQNAKHLARDKFNPDEWINEIIGIKENG